jgi:predicted Zn-dependent protease
MNKLILVLLVLMMGCGKEEKKASKVKTADLFRVQSLKINVYYQPGAEPYISAPLASIFPNLSSFPSLTLEYWSVSERNIQALFKERKNYPSIIVPKKLDQMKAIPYSEDTSWTVDEVMALNKKHQLSDETGNFHIYFLNGHASEGKNIIGFQIDKTTVIAIFKDVIRETSQESTPFVAEYVEQSTIIHELGHAIGLVNNDIPMVEKHQEHGHHCSNPDCVMYYSNAGATGLIQHAKKVLASPNPLEAVMFDELCLKDTKAY